MPKYPEKSRNVTVPTRSGAIVDITLFELSMGYVGDAEEGVIKDTPTNALLDASSASKEIIRSLAYGVGDALYSEIIEMTFGKKTPDSDGEEDGKK